MSTYKQWPIVWEQRNYGTPDQHGWVLAPTESWGENVLLLGQPNKPGCASLVAVYDELEDRTDIEVEVYAATPEQVAAGEYLKAEQTTIPFVNGWGTRAMELINLHRALAALEKVKE